MTDGLTSREQELLDERLRRAADGAPRGAAIPHREPGAPAPLSFAQTRLWFFDRLMPGSPLYNLSFAARIGFALDVRVLKRALQLVVERHEALRTVFANDGEDPVQVVLPSVDVPLRAIDLRRLAPDRREQEVVRQAARFQDEPFDLASGPLLRAMVAWLAPRDFLLVVGAHHVVADGWSLGILAGELETTYQALARGREPQLRELEVQYADFASWQRERLSGETLAAEVDHWRTRLAGLPVLELPTDRPRPPVQLHRGADLAFTVSSGLVERLSRLGRERGATLFMTLLAGFDVVLGRWARQDDLAVGAPIANRNRAEIEGLIGFFVNTLVLRVDLSGNPTFAELLDRVREVALQAYAHQDLPFEKLVEELAPPRDLSRNPLVQVIFQLFETTANPDAVALSSGVSLPSRTSLFDLRVDLAPGRGGLSGRVEYDTDLFARITIERLVERYLRLLEQVAVDPGRPIAGYELLTPEEHLLLADWNATSAPVPQRPVHELVSAAAARASDSVAVVEADGTRHTYGEIEARSNQLANHLRSLGVGPGAVVGVCLPRDALLVTGLLGVLKAGAAYLPLETDLPPARLALMAEDAGVELSLTTSAQRRFLPPGAEALELDAAWPADAATSAPEPMGEVPAVAWVLFTSGSSGVPKGVAGSHVGLVNRVGWGLRVEPFVGGEVCCAKSRLGFVDSVCELFLPLTAGVPVVIADDASLRDPVRLAGLLVREGVTRLVAVPSLLRVLFDVCADTLTGSALRSITASGEPLLGTDVTRIREVLPEARIWNIYGCTEVAADATAHEVTSGVEERIPIGRPLDNVQVHLHGPDGEPVPLGAIGEIHIGGLGLSPGYIGHAQHQDTRFTTTPTGRLYATGDLGRWRPDGTLEHHGRADRQIKIRGVRAEPGEIEHALTTHPNINEAAVITHTHNHDTALIAFYTPQHQDPNPDQLRTHLRTHLPEQLIPTHLIQLPQLPHLPNGKLDHHTLTQHTTTNTSVRVYEAPEGIEEHAVAEVFAELTGAEQVGRHDDFFALGGHSLLATRAVSRLGERLRREIELRLLFEHRTVADFAAAVAALAATAQAPAAPIARLDRERYRTRVDHPPKAG